MKHRSKANGSSNDDWATPDYLLNYIKGFYFCGQKFFDPCPLKPRFNGLKIVWKKTIILIHLIIEKIKKHL